jgi:hypothetical protein
MRAACSSGKTAWTSRGCHPRSLKIQRQWYLQTLLRIEHKLIKWENEKQEREPGHAKRLALTRHWQQKGKRLTDAVGLIQNHYNVLIAPKLNKWSNSFWTFTTNQMRHLTEICREIWKCWNGLISEKIPRVPGSIF